MSLLARVSEALRTRGIPHVLVGASALTIHGVNRSTIVGPERDALIAGVERELSDLPADASRLWRQILELGS